MSRHPSNRRLRSWVKSGRPTRLGEHVAHCDRCTELLEEDMLSSSILVALANMTAPPDDLEERMAVSVTDAVRNRQALGALAELFGIGWRTGAVMLDATHEEEEDE